MDEAKRKKLAASLGLPEDATEAQIKARVAEVRAAADDAGIGEEESTPPDNTHQTPPGTVPSGAGASGNPSDTDVPTPEEQDEKIANTDPDEDPDAEASFVRVDKATWEQTQRNAALAAKHENERISARQQGKVTAAIQAGKIPPARKAHYTKLMAADEQGTTELLDSLMPSAVPVGQQVGALGHEEELEAANGAGLPDEWFPTVAKLRREVAVASNITNAKEA